MVVKIRTAAGCYDITQYITTHCQKPFFQTSVFSCAPCDEKTVYSRENVLN